MQRTITVIALCAARRAIHNVIQNNFTLESWIFVKSTHVAFHAKACDYSMIILYVIFNRKIAFLSFLSEDLSYTKETMLKFQDYFTERDLSSRKICSTEDTYKFLETNIFIPRYGNNLAISVCVRGKTDNFYGCVKIYSNRLCAELRAIMVCHLFSPKSVLHAGTYPLCRRGRRARVNAVDL